MELHVSPKKLSKTSLNNLDILRAILFEKESYKRKTDSKKEPGISVLANILATKIEGIYRKPGVDLKGKDALKKKVCEVYKYRQKMLKFSRTQRRELVFVNRMKMYRQFMSQTLDVFSKHRDQKPKKRKLRVRNSWIIFKLR